MAQAELLQGEHLVMSSQDDVLMLTNYRVKYESLDSGGSVYRSIPLAKVSTCTVATKKYPAMLWAAVILVSLGLFAPDRAALVFAVVVAAVLVLLYYFIRPGLLVVVSDSGVSIDLPTKGLRHEDTRRFVEAIAFEVSKAK